MTEKKLVAVDGATHNKTGGICPYCEREVKSQIGMPIVARITCSECEQPFLVIDAKKLCDPQKLAELPGCGADEVFGCQVIRHQGGMQIRHQRGQVVEVYTWQKPVPPARGARQKQQQAVV